MKKRSIVFVMLIVILSLTLISCQSNQEKHQEKISEERGENLREQYLEKYEARIKEGEDIRKEFDNGEEESILAGADKEYRLWDGFLADVYEEINSILTEDGEIELENNHREWEVKRDKRLEEELINLEEGYTERIARLNLLIEETQNRAYDLIDEYM